MRDDIENITAGEYLLLWERQIASAIHGLEAIKAVRLPMQNDLSASYTAVGEKIQRSMRLLRAARILADIQPHEWERDETSP